MPTAWRAGARHHNAAWSTATALAVRPRVWLQLLALDGELVAVT
ncbi:hypothetical protein [Streptomyces inhibens]|nr:hypothetical protein [Streptomyces inhibens]